MEHEEGIKQVLLKKFPFLEGKINVQRIRRIFLDVDYARFEEVLGYALKDMDFSMLCGITGLDEGENLAFIYHLSRQGSITLNIKTAVPKQNPLLKSIIPYFVNAEIYERELADLFGANVSGLPAGNRYPLTDDWPRGEFPLRKDWQAPSKSASQGGV